MADTTPQFDAAKYKATTREQWQSAAAAWHRWGPALEQWLGPATETLLNITGVRAGSQVLDVAARRMGPTGRVLATDIL